MALLETVGGGNKTAELRGKPVEERHHTMLVDECADDKDLPRPAPAPTVEEPLPVGTAAMPTTCALAGKPAEHVVAALRVGDRALRNERTRPALVAPRREATVPAHKEDPMPFILVRLLNIRARWHALILIGAAAVLIVVGGVVFAATQHLPVTTGWYWAITTATTVGYGDVVPKNASGRFVASVVMLTTVPLLAGAFAVMTGSAVVRGVRRLLDVGARFPEGSYILVLGTHPAIPIVLKELESAGDAVILVADVDPSTVPHHVHLIKGDPTSEDTLARGHPERASRILIAGEDDGDVLVSAVLVRQEAPDVPVTALVSSRRLIPALKDLGVLQVLSPDDLTGHTVAKGLEAPHAGELLMHLVRGEEHRLVEHRVETDQPPRLLSEVRGERRELVLGLVRGSFVSLGVADDPEVHPGDLLLLVEPNGHRGHRHHDGECRHGADVSTSVHDIRTSFGAERRGVT